jgi:hypothetical protein
MLKVCRLSFLFCCLLWNLSFLALELLGSLYSVLPISLEILEHQTFLKFDCTLRAIFQESLTLSLSLSKLTNAFKLKLQSFEWKSCWALLFLQSMKNLEGSLEHVYYDQIWTKELQVLEDLGFKLTDLILANICLLLHLIYKVKQNPEYNPLIYFEDLSLLIWSHCLQLWYFCNEK